MAARSRRPANCSSARRAATASPASALRRTVVDGERVAVTERIVWERPFGRVISFDREPPQAEGAAEAPDGRADVGPLRHAAARHGRGLPADHKVFITDWADARTGAARRRPLRSRRLHRLPDRHVPGARPDLHVMAVCQPAVPVIAAIARMEAENDPLHPALDDPDGRADRHAPLADRRQPARRRSAASSGSAATASSRCRRPIRASGATSIRASCSSPASWR